MARLGARLKHMWNAFIDQDEKYRIHSYDLGASYGIKPDRTRMYISNERSIISSIYTRVSIDVSANQLLHVRIDDQDRIEEEIESGLNNCLNVEANIDQAARAFRQDIVMSLFDRGIIAIVPIDTTLNPEVSGSYDIKTLRVGTIVQWYPQHVRVDLYNDKTGLREEVTLQKSVVAIVENPLYSVMNEPNSTLQRLIRKLNLLDGNDEAASSGKLDLIIQLPYVIKSEARKQQAEQRRKDIEFQLKGSTYGIAYTDGTEKITQLNRPAENTLLKQIEYLTGLLYNQLGLTEDIMNGTASEQAMLNYYNRTIDPVLTAVVEAMARTFLTKTARSQGQSIISFKDPFRLVPINDIAEIADKFTRNEILTANEVRQIIGFKPNKDPRADKLQNSNMPVGDLGIKAPDQNPMLPPSPNGSTKPNNQAALLSR
jgi:Phage portal protein